MYEKLLTLQTLLGAGRLILTGSTALAFHGLNDLAECKDLDLILVGATDHEKQILKDLHDANPSKSFIAGGCVDYSFIHEGVKVDVWLMDSHEDTVSTYTKEGIRLASVRSIVNAMIKIGRSKDWVKLMQYSGKIFDQKKFNEILPALTNHSNNYQPTGDKHPDLPF